MMHPPPLTRQLSPLAATNAGPHIRPESPPTIAFSESIARFQALMLALHLALKRHFKVWRDKATPLTFFRPSARSKLSASQDTFYAVKRTTMTYEMNSLVLHCAVEMHVQICSRDSERLCQTK
jgi:hypothetical protein